MRIAYANIFKNDYDAYIELARTYAKKYGILLIALDAVGAEMTGDKSYQWITNNYGGYHINPYNYLAFLGITQQQLTHDLVHDISIICRINSICNLVQAYSSYELL